jgi:anti-sigma factor RsiW
VNDLACNEFVELVTAHLDRALDAETEARFAAHLTECDGCTRYLDQVRQTVEALGGLTPETLPAEARTALLNAFRDRTGPDV